MGVESGAVGRRVLEEVLGRVLATVGWDLEEGITTYSIGNPNVVKG